MRLAARVIRGALSLSVLNNLMILANFVIQIVLARHLSPEIFGTVALAFAILSFFQFFIYWGTNAILMQDGRDPALADTLFFLRLIFSLFIVALVIGAYYILQPFYNSDILNSMLVLSICTIATFIYDVFKAVMQKGMMLAALGWIDLICVVLGGVIAITLVLQGFGLWTLVSFHILTTVIRGIGYILMSPYRPSMRFSRSEAIWAWRFGRKILLVGALDNIDFRLGDWFLGTIRGEAELGIYGLAWRISHLFQRLFLPVLEFTALPAFAQLKDNQVMLQQAYHFVIRTLIRLLTPSCILFALFAPELITLLVGEQWLDSVPVFRILLLFAIASPLFRMHQQLYYALGRPKQYLKVKIYQVGMFIISTIPLTMIWGGEGLGLSLGLGFCFGVVFILIQTHKFILVPFWTIINTLIAGTIALAPAVLIKQQTTALPTVLSYPASILIFLLIYIAWLYVSERNTVTGDFRQVLSALFHPKTKSEKPVSQ